MSELEGAPRKRAGGPRGSMTHLDADVLAEFQAGLITGRRGARMTAHLAGCERCTALGEQLAGVSALLASVPVPAMPDSVARRLDTVLAAEVASKDHPERVGVDRPGEASARHRRAPRPGFRLLALRVLAPVAVVLLAAGGYGLSRLVGPGGQATASSAGSADAKAAAPPSARAANGRAHSGQSSPLEGAKPRQRRMTPANFVLVASTTDFSAVPATGASLVLVESARFDGRPATLVVTRASQGETAWIAGPNCSATSRDILISTSVPTGTSEP